MHITVDSTELKEAVARCASVIPSRTTKEVLQNVLFRVDDKLTLVGTNMETTVLAEVEAQITKPGKALLSAERLSKFVKELSGSLSFEVDGQEVILTAPGARYRIPTSNPDEYPAPSLLKGDATELDSESLLRAIKKTIFATDTDSARYALGGIRFDDWMVIGCDGRRLSTCPVTGASGEISAIVPEKAAQLIASVLHEEKCHVGSDLNNVQVRCGKFIVNTRQLEGRYPDWRKALATKEGKNRATLTAGSFLSAVRQAAIVADQEYRGVLFEFSTGEIKISAQTSDRGQSSVSVPAEYSGEAVTVRWDNVFVQEFLKTCDPEEMVSVYVGAPTESALIEDAAGAAYTLMPMAVS